MNDLRDSAFALREAQRAYMADRGNEAKGKAVAAAAERLDAAIAAVDAGQAGRVHRMVAENDALRNAIGSRVDAALSAAQPEGGDAVGYATQIAQAMWRKHYADDAPNWTPFDGLMGVLSQIDNMATGLARPAPAQQAVTDAKDAARYRFLRDRSECQDDFNFVIREVSAYTFLPHPYENIRHETLDAAIDAAIASNAAAKAAEGAK